MASELQEIRSELSRDTGARRLQVEKELSQMKQATTTLPEVSGAPKTHHHSHPQAPMLTEAECKSLIARSEKTIDVANALPRKVEKTILKIRQDSDAVGKRSTKLLAKRTQELSGMKRQIEENLKDVDATQNQASQACGREEFRLENLAGDKGKEPIEARIGELKNFVEELSTARKGLVEELRSKVAALEIDNSCRRVTPQVAAEPKKPAMLQASSSMPNFTQKQVGATPSASSKSMSSTELTDVESQASTMSPGGGNYLPAIHPKPKSPQKQLNKSSSEPYFTLGASASLRMAAQASLTPSGSAGGNSLG